MMSNERLESKSKKTAKYLVKGDAYDARKRFQAYLIKKKGRKTWAVGK